jgi:Rrf2 family nitric oxide-sensitive transcriptional repressor
MQLTLHADYALRVLLYLSSHPGRMVSTQAISPGRNGGVTLARPVEAIRIGDVVRATETNLALVECFDMKTNTCVIAQVCRLKGVLQEALRGFLSVLDEYTLADLMANGGGERLSAAFIQKRIRQHGARSAS